ncbi:MAG TPA: D-glucuronyl C5-epimerase family protein [Solirubrobacterales bacterium]|nr:D-glucuronyl C5-epimerase family protein [Solirubrobacterales bacterium]
MSRRQPGRLRKALREVSAGYSAIAGRTIDFEPQPLGRNVDPDGIAGYYSDLRHKTVGAVGAVGGLPVNAFGDVNDWVIEVAQAALGFWERRLEGEPVEREFLFLADWLLENRDEEPRGVVWRIDVPVPKYGQRPGWISAMGQGQAISVLLRAHRLSGDERYLEAARGALPALCRPVREGGTQSSIDGHPVLEEYPTDRPCAVLNGWIFALFGVHELAVADDDATARELFRRSASGLLELLPRYDVGWWSLYSLYDHGRRDLAKPFYQRLHPELLDGLALIHPDPRLAEYAERWRAQYTARNVARASFDKVGFRLYRALR